MSEEGSSQIEHDLDPELNTTKQFQVNESLPSIALNVNESREILWGKTKLGFQVKGKNKIIKTKS